MFSMEPFLCLMCDGPGTCDSMELVIIGGASGPPPFCSAGKAHMVLIRPVHIATTRRAWGHPAIAGAPATPGARYVPYVHYLQPHLISTARLTLCTADFLIETTWARQQRKSTQRFVRWGATHESTREHPLSKAQPTRSFVLRPNSLWLSGRSSTRTWTHKNAITHTWPNEHKPHYHSNSPFSRRQKQSVRLYTAYWLQAGAPCTRVLRPLSSQGLKYSNICRAASSLPTASQLFRTKARPSVCSFHQCENRSHIVWSIGHVSQCHCRLHPIRHALTSPSQYTYDIHNLHIQNNFGVGRPVGRCTTGDVRYMPRHSLYQGETTVAVRRPSLLRNKTTRHQIFGTSPSTRATGSFQSPRPQNRK